MGVKEIGERIYLARAAKRMSQQELATRIGRSHGWISLIERGAIMYPTKKDIAALERTLGLRENELASLMPADDPGERLGRRATLTEAEIEALVERVVDRRLQATIEQSIAAAISQVSAELAPAAVPQDSRGSRRRTKP